ncbi:MAG: HAD family phosphatase [Oscillospiraceae bacterium]|nr:HAD family phosphatase [Oscillospiraceae bacterium]
MLINPLKLVIFDKDGLMMDTERPVVTVWNEVFTEWGLEPLSEEAYTKFVGFDRRGNMRQMQAFFPQANAEELCAACGLRTREYFTNNPIDTKPGLFELFDALDELGVKKAVATSSGSRSAHMTLEKCGILPRVDAVISGDMVERNKPAPDIYLLAAKTLGADPSECLVLEDSNAGVTAANAAGMAVIVVPDMIDTPPDILELCLCRCDSLHDVIPILFA